VSPTTVGLAVVSEYLAAVPRVVRDLRSRGVALSGSGSDQALTGTAGNEH